MFNGETIHISGGLFDYIGELDQSEHPLGKGWWRIKNPCIALARNNPTNNKVELVIAPMRGDPGDKNYKNHVDFYIPETMRVDIKTLDKKGRLYNHYQKRISQAEPSRIIVPDLALGAIRGKA